MPQADAVRDVLVVQAAGHDVHRGPGEPGPPQHAGRPMYLLPPIGEPDPAAVMPTFLQQARAAGVRRAVRPPRDRALHTARPDDGYFEGLPVATQYFRIQKRY